MFGVGNVVLYVVFKVVEKGGKVILLFNSWGFLYNENGLIDIVFKWVIDNCVNCNNIFIDMVDENMGKWIVDKKFWYLKCDIVLFCVM